MAGIKTLFEKLWEDYKAINPQAEKIHKLLADRGETIINDHIAFRAYARPRADLDAIADVFIRYGYEPAGDYEFSEKKLRAKHFEHLDDQLPRVFISELKVDEFSEEFRAIVDQLVAQIPEELPKRWDFPVSGRPWGVSYEQYERLRSESEYGAWLAAFGFRANHFTVSVNELSTFGSLGELNDFLKRSGFELNAAGGEIKGSPGDYLEQSSTLADEAEVEFSDGAKRIPACYYEFARRYEMPDGRLFSGFVAKSADKIFQSTDRRS